MCRSVQVTCVAFLSTGVAFEGATTGDSFACGRRVPPASGCGLAVAPTPSDVPADALARLAALREGTVLQRWCISPASVR
eukprot:2902188-Pleurochrysis_carterae.AAC.2